MPILFVILLNTKRIIKPMASHAENFIAGNEEVSCLFRLYHIFKCIMNTIRYQRFVVVLIIMIICALSDFLTSNIVKRKKFKVTTLVHQHPTSQNRSVLQFQFKNKNFSRFFPKFIFDFLLKKENTCLHYSTHFTGSHYKWSHPTLETFI